MKNQTLEISAIIWTNNLWSEQSLTISAVTLGVVWSSNGTASSHLLELVLDDPQVPIIIAGSGTSMMSVAIIC